MPEVWFMRAWASFQKALGLRQRQITATMLYIVKSGDKALFTLHWNMPDATIYDNKWVSAKHDSLSHTANVECEKYIFCGIRHVLTRELCNSPAVGLNENSCPTHAHRVCVMQIIMMLASHDNGYVVLKMMQAFILLHDFRNHEF